MSRMISGVEIGAPRGRRVLEDDLDARHFLGDRPVERGDRGGAGAEALRRLDHDRVDASHERAAGDAHHFAHICGTRAGDDRQLLCAGDHDLEKLVSFLRGSSSTSLAKPGKTRPSTPARTAKSTIRPMAPTGTEPSGANGVGRTGKIPRSNVSLPV